MTVVADTSVWIAAVRTRDEAFFADTTNGLVRSCPVVTMELLSGLSNPREIATWRQRLQLLTETPITPAVTARAEEVLHRLARLRGGHHRDVPVADLLIAAAAEERGVALLHRDRHFVQIAAVTGQPQHWYEPATTAARRSPGRTPRP